MCELFYRNVAKEITQFLTPYETSQNHATASNEAPPSAATQQKNLNDLSQWNPFVNSVPRSNLAEDHAFGQEFDKIRRGSQSSMQYTYLNYFFNFLKILLLNVIHLNK